MALVLNDRVKETTTTTGTGTLTLAGAVTGFETFGTGVGNSNTTYYAVTLPGTAEFEVGLGTLSSDSSTIARTTVISSSNSDNAVNFSAGTKTIFCTLPASKTVFLDASGNATLGADLSVGDDLTVNGGVIELKNTGAQSELRMYCESANAHYAALKAPAHSDFAGNTTLTLPATTDVIVGRATTDTLTNKTLTSPKINEDVAVTATATEINKLDGVTATTTELNYVDVTTLGTVEASKAVTADSSGNVTFPDNEILKLGTGGDLQIYHSGNNSIIQDAGTGALIFMSNTYSLRNAANDEQVAVFNEGGSIELYHNNSKKLETTSSGATVTGDLTVTSTADGGPNLNIKSNDHGDAADFANEGFINFIADNDADQEVTFGRIGTFPADVTDGTEDGRIRMDIMANGSIQGAYQFAPGYLFLLNDTHRIEWQNTRGTSFNIDLLTATPTANREITLPDATGTVLTTGNSDTPSTTTSSSDADFVLVDDGGTMKKITPSNLGITTGSASKGFAVAMAIAL